MLKKTITFEDLEGNEVTKDFYFNLSVDEVAELEVSRDEGLAEYMQDVLRRKDNKELLRLFKMLIRKSIGVKHEDGLRFIKSEEISDSFTQTSAYGQLIVELSTEADAAAEFFKGILPSKTLEKLSKSKTSETPAKETPDWVKEQRPPTEEELLRMSREEMMLAYRVKNAANPEAELKKLL